MSKRTIGDYIASAFLARDKASVDAIKKEAETALATVTHDQDHDEPDGDEGKQAIVIHNHHNESGNGNGNGDDNGTDDADWRKSVDTGMNEIRDALKAISDKLTARDEFPPKKDDDDKDDDDKDTKDTDAKDEELSEKVGEGAQTGSPPPSAEPDLMEADPALKMGPGMMGDAGMQTRINQAMNNLIRDTRARAEVLSPGIKVGVLDGALGDDRMKQAGQRICDIRRAALTAAAGTERGMVAIGRHTKDAIGKMHCDAVRLLFVDASDRMRSMNNAQNLPSPQFGNSRRATNDSLRSQIEGINKRNAEFWANQSGGGRRAG